MFPYLLTILFLLPLSFSLPPHRPPPFTPTSTTPSTLTLHPPPPPTTFFQVTKPINHPKTTCSHLILHHNFASTYGDPPVTAPYTPPTHCPPTTFSSAVLEWSATCRGRQFDRIFGIWLGGVELLRSCTAEPTKDGIIWKIHKDITKYSSLLKSNNTLSVFLGNIVDKTYTGVYHVNITIHFYYDHKNLGSGYDQFADLILPISRNLPLNDGLWFEINNSTQVVQSKGFMIPKNVYRAVLEVYVSFHENDEFWYSNLPNDYLMANNLTSPGNGPFREVLVSLDGDLAGGIWPFTVIYTGGINPLLWRPITGIGSFDLPTYDIEITPFLGKLLDGKVHDFGFSVTNALNVWYIDANLHLWLDKSGKHTKGQLMENKIGLLINSSESHFKGLNGKFPTNANRFISTTGWVESSYGNITTTSDQNFEFCNFMVVNNNGDLQIVNQTIGFNTSVLAHLSSSSSPLYRKESYKKFPLFLYADQVDQGNHSYKLFSNVSLGFDEDKNFAIRSKVSSSSLRNKQNAEGTMFVKHNLVASGVGKMHQIYQYEESSGEFCYYRNVGSSNYTIIYDKVSDKCKSSSQNHVISLANHGCFPA